MCPAHSALRPARGFGRQVRLRARVKSSPLGSRYIATRVTVQELARDDKSAAVSGISSGDFIITTSNKPVEAGKQVRLADNG